MLSTIIALIAGFFGGVALDIEKSNQNQNQSATPSEITTAVVAEDFASPQPSITTLPADPISEAEKQDLLYMREEEKLARDVYQTLHEKWQIQIFSNIAFSEQTHSEAIRDLLVKYSITDPVTDDTIGVFVNADLQTLYHDLTRTGLTSIEDALTVGALIEELDIKDLQDTLSRTNNSDISAVYENLLRGSQNHLRAFNKQLVVKGVTYTPQHISKATFDAIVAGNTETKNGGGQQRGWEKKR